MDVENVALILPYLLNFLLESPLTYVSKLEGEKNRTVKDVYI